MIEFFSYRPFNAKITKPAEAFGQPHYVAYVLRRQGAPQWVELGEAKEIDEAVAALRRALSNPKRADAKRLARQVDKRVMQPVRALLGDTRRALISPDGALNLFPFAALADERNNYLVTRYEFSYLTSGRDLLRLQVPRESKGGPLIVAAPAFGEMPNADESDGRNIGLPKGDQNTGAQPEFPRLYFRPLPGTAEEAQALERLLPQAKALTGEQATEKALKQASSPSILHIATHGFFLKDLDAAPVDTRGLVLLREEPRCGVDGRARRYGTGSGSDRAPAGLDFPNTTRSLPLPVPYRFIHILVCEVVIPTEGGIQCFKPEFIFSSSGWLKIPSPIRRATTTPA